MHRSSCSHYGCVARQDSTQGTGAANGDGQPLAGPSRPRPSATHARSHFVHSPLEKESSSSPSIYKRTSDYARSLQWTKEETDEFLLAHRTVVTAGTASLVSTAASFPFDSVKSRLQVRDYPSIWACAKSVVREEGFRGFFRGVTIPLVTISFVRTSSFSIYYNTKKHLHSKNVFNDSSRLLDTALSGAAGGATSGVIISCGSAPFELVKVQRQLEYLIAVQKGLVKKSSPDGSGGRTFVPQSGFQAAANIYRNFGGIKGFYLGFPLHMARDTFGTALYFGFYDSIRKLVSRHSTTDSISGPSLYGIPGPVVSFLSGSSAGILSWLIVYPVDLIKTKVQRDALAGNPRQFTGWQVFLHMIKERPPIQQPGQKQGMIKTDTFLARFLRLYRGLGVSALRSFISHGLTWTLIETISGKITERTGQSISYAPDAKRQD
ncbi:related to carnitine/acylcarnitine translocase [Sporisorium reilianum SRZ2]|uniref:Related to carnitine/acylcarnitine translocase n=2 Tax=Sporisorium reilianum TaxID=72558 RepID=E6ZK10_SPORE|nr:related to carnitine/acylcarnitine translocase [Sporisorium reilianum SRZ2]SJX60299.1 related to carnitine/acylcarnitine translocase [Sporisorium reilianum f. sp. reilianum]